MRARRGPQVKSPPRDGGGRSEPSRSRRKDFIGELDPRAAQDAERGGHFRARFVRFQSLAAPFPGDSHPARPLPIEEGKPRACGSTGPPAAPFPGANSMFSSLCGAISGRPQLPGQARRVTLAVSRVWACFHRVRPLQKRGKRAPIARQIASQAPKIPSISFNFLHFLSANRALSTGCAGNRAKKKIHCPSFAPKPYRTWRRGRG